MSEKGNTPLKWANDKEDPKHAQSHAPALVCLLLVQRPTDTKAIRADFDPNGHTHSDKHTLSRRKEEVEHDMVTGGNCYFILFFKS